MAASHKCHQPRVPSLLPWLVSIVAPEFYTLCSIARKEGLDISSKDGDLELPTALTRRKTA